MSTLTPAASALGLPGTPVLSPPLHAPVVASASQSTLACDLAARYQAVRAASEALCEGLEVEDFVVQSMPDCSPAKWHLAHTSWFFETFLLKPHAAYQSRHPEYNFLFNSYYNAIGERHCRPQRGLLSRPTVRDTFAYRHEIDRAMLEWLGNFNEAAGVHVASLIVLGLHHEQQHQELLVTDLKHAFASNPLRPIFRARDEVENGAVTPPLEWRTFEAGLYEIGDDETRRDTRFDADFAFDNEGPRHRQWLERFALASRLVTCAEYLEFMHDGGYTRPELWLSMGWNVVQSEGWRAPLYWEERDGEWQQMTLSGMRRVEKSEPVCHVSYFEADAFARWAAAQFDGARLPTEAEWEIAATSSPIDGSFVETQNFHPSPLSRGGTAPQPAHTPLRQMFGEVWQWTRSPYVAYPGYVADAGALGEYNGKFMCNQWVLRGGSCATPRSHIRATYRNFFSPEARWQFSGIRLARDI